MSPTISVVIPTRDRARYLNQALDSVFAQTFLDYEIIVVDDGSTDETRRILAPLVEDKKIYYEYQQATGVSAARNRGIELARGQYVAFLDSDDLFLPDKLEKQYELFKENPTLGFVHCSFSKFDDGGNDLGVRDTSRFRGQLYPWMLQEWSILMAMPCMLMRTMVLKEIGGFDESMKWAEDMDLWRRVARKYRVGVVSEVLVKVRVHETSTTFERSGGAQGFRRYLDKAFAEDPSLSSSFKRKAYAKMHSKLAQNLLGNGSPNHMRLARKHSWESFVAWPLEMTALAAYLASFLPTNLRRFLVNRLRRIRYPVIDT